MRKAEVPGVGEIRWSGPSAAAGKTPPVRLARLLNPVGRASIKFTFQAVCRFIVIHIHLYRIFLFVCFFFFLFLFFHNIQIPTPNPSIIPNIILLTRRTTPAPLVAVACSLAIVVPNEMSLAVQLAPHANPMGQHPPPTVSAQ